MESTTQQTTTVAASSTTAKTDSFKLYFEGQQDIRRVTLTSSDLFPEIVKQLYTLYSEDGLYHPELRITYIDEEGDKVTVSSQVEWNEMLAAIGTERPIKLFITDSILKGKYFKDGPAPQYQYFYVNNNGDAGSSSSSNSEISSKPVEEKKPQQKISSKDNESLQTLQITVPNCLERLFPGGKILPYHLPEWLRDSGAVTLIKNNTGVDQPEIVDVDIDIYKLLSVLQRQALNFIGADKTKEELIRAKDYLLSILTIDTINQTALYNLACAESLLGNIEAAVEALFAAVTKSGYCDVDHMEKDSDLDNIRSSPKYRDILNLLRPQKVVVPAEEPKKVVVEEPKPVVFVPEPTPVAVAPIAVPEPAAVVPVAIAPVVPAEEPKKVVVAEKPKPIVVAPTPVVEVAKPQQPQQPQVPKPKPYAKSKWSINIEILENMGFDASLCEFLLDRYNGDTIKVIDILTAGKPI